MPTANWFSLAVYRHRIQNRNEFVCPGRMKVNLRFTRIFCPGVVRAVRSGGVTSALTNFVSKGGRFFWYGKVAHFGRCVVLLKSCPCRSICSYFEKLPISVDVSPVFKPFCRCEAFWGSLSEKAARSRQPPGTNLTTVVRFVLQRGHVAACLGRRVPQGPLRARPPPLPLPNRSGHTSINPLSKSTLLFFFIALKPRDV